MNFKKLIIATATGLILSACGSGSNANAGQKSQEMTEPAANGPVQEYEQNAAISPDKTLPVVIDFNATWCGPCQRFAPIFTEAAKEYKGKAIFMSVNVDNSPEAARQFEVSAIPQISILMPDGSINSTVGFMDKAQFAEFLSKALPSK